MATNYPGSLDTFDTIGASDEMNDEVGTRTHREMHNDANDAIEAIEAELGTNPSGAYDTVAARLASVDVSTLLVKANNLSDLASASTARTNLGLGTAAVADTGTGAGTVAAGDDSRLSDARTPTDGSVSTVKIADGAVTPIKVGSRYVAKTSAYTLTAADEVVDCTSGTFTVTLPSAAGVAGRMFTVKNSGTGVITIGRTSSQTIDGVNANVVLGGKGSFTVLSTGAAWIVIQGSYTDESVGRRIFTWDQTNGRWQMTYGDTGWRNVNGSLLNGWGAGTGLHVRRINSSVEWVSLGISGAAKTDIAFIAVSSGWHPTPTPTYGSNFAVSNNGAAIVSITHTNASTIAAPLTGTLWGRWGYSTSDGWPASLPGSAVGSIPT